MDQQNSRQSKAKFPSTDVLCCDGSSDFFTDLFLSFFLVLNTTLWDVYCSFHLKNVPQMFRTRN